MKKILLSMTCFFFCATAPIALAKSFSLPENLQALSPHHPAVVAYVVQDCVEHQQMTPKEAEKTLAYMKWRHARRQQDLTAVAHMSPEERRAYMHQKRIERGNPLVEYAHYLETSIERAQELMNLLHPKAKGDRYAEKMKRGEK